nr:hypothetical protein Iba_scaffold3997CG0390 [Ipomoea batatas]
MVQWMLDKQERHQVHDIEPADDSIRIRGRGKTGSKCKKIIWRTSSCSLVFLELINILSIIWKTKLNVSTGRDPDLQENNKPFTTRSNRPGFHWPPHWLTEIVPIGHWHPLS